MARLNYDHLLYFWTTAQEGTIARASRKLHLTQPTISSQIHRLEESLGTKLFVRTGRNLVLTEAGRLVCSYAEDIFGLGRELISALEGELTDRPQQFVVGVNHILPRLVVHRFLEPALRSSQRIRLICHDDIRPRLLSRLALREIDLILSDSPAPTTAKPASFSHLLAECGVSFLATPELAKRYRKGFPGSLNGAPVLLPAEATIVRWKLDEWFSSERIRPDVRGEFLDCDMFEVLGEAGHGLFAVPTLIEADEVRQNRLRVVGRVDDVRHQFFAITLEQKTQHPGAAAILNSALRTAPLACY